jgi:hypothetical protein
MSGDSRFLTAASRRFGMTSVIYDYLKFFTARSTSVTCELLPHRFISAYPEEEFLQALKRTSLVMGSLHLYGLVAAGGVALMGVYALLRRKPKSPDDLERERRAWLEGTGRITDGTVIDVQELAPPENYRQAVMLIYKYDVAGVSYECSQDVTYLRQWINLHSCRLGLHTSVKYDPQNPGNSLVVSENWMGLRQ